jgi:cyclopropane fatty-acyl-phospholipid synthase-like methyltransferase
MSKDYLKLGRRQRFIRSVKVSLVVYTRWVRSMPYSAWILSSLGGILAYVVVTYLVKETFLSGLAKDKPVTFHLVSFITIIGVSATIWGFWKTFDRLSLINDRITSYRQFFTYTEALFNEIRMGTAHSFYFYGPTILPGNLVYRNGDEIDKYRDEIETLMQRLQGYKSLEKILVIVPSIAAYGESYDKYMDKIPDDFVDARRWKEEVNKSRKLAIEFQQDLAIKTDELITVEGSQLAKIEHAYFISNGVRIVIVFPLHYVDSQKSTFTVHLFGYTTIDPSIVRCFIQNATNLAYDRKLSFLNLMYGSHLISEDYVKAELKHANKTYGPGLKIEDVWDLDHDHFLGRAATQECINIIKINSRDEVLDIGSGLGGPARYIAFTAKCNVTGIELQKDRNRFANELTEYLELDDRVKLELGDITDRDIYEIKYRHEFTCLVSFLSILHVYSKERLLSNLGKMLKTRGRLFIEDYVQGDAYGTALKEDKLKQISCPGLLTLEKYKDLLELGGFADVKIVLMTDNWHEQARLRYEIFVKERASYLDRGHSELRINQATQFAENVHNLFKARAITGIRVTATLQYST